VADTIILVKKHTHVVQLIVIAVVFILLVASHRCSFADFWTGFKKIDTFFFVVIMAFPFKSIAPLQESGYEPGEAVSAL